jgi:hypothetical protein
MRPSRNGREELGGEPESGLRSAPAGQAYQAFPSSRNSTVAAPRSQRTSCNPIAIQVDLVALLVAGSGRSALTELFLGIDVET